MVNYCGLYLYFFGRYKEIIDFKIVGIKLAIFKVV